MSSSGTSGQGAFRWNGGSMEALDDLLGGLDGWELKQARGINDAGWITSMGITNGEERAFLLKTNTAPSVTVTSPTNGSAFFYGTNFTIEALASDDVAVATTSLYDGNRRIAEAAGAVGSTVLSSPDPGDHDLYAVATDNIGVASTSVVVRVAVGLHQVSSVRLWLKNQSIGLYADGA